MTPQTGNSTFSVLFVIYTFTPKPRRFDRIRRWFHR